MAEKKVYTAAQLSELSKTLDMSVTLPNGMVYKFTIDDVANIDPDDIQAELVGHSQRYAFYARLCVETKIVVADQQRVTDDIVTAADMRIRAELESALEPGPRGAIPKVSETEIKRRVSLDERVIAARKKLAEQSAQEDRLASARETLMHRRDMLSALAMFRAPEGSGDPEKRAQYRLKR